VSGLRPANGGRISLTLRDVGTEVVYDVTLYLPDGEVLGVAEVSLASGQSEVRWDGEAPAWLARYVGPLLRQLWTKRREGGPRWPRRVTRWRAEP